MSPADKQYEDSFNQGGNGKDPAKTDVPNHVTDAPRKDVIPDSTVVFGPVNIPKHVFEDQWQAGEAPKKASPTGISLGVLTVRNEERASRLAKELFAKKLVAEVQVQEGGFHRSYLKFGKIETEVSRARMTLSLPTIKLPSSSSTSTMRTRTTTTIPFRTLCSPLLPAEMTNMSPGFSSTPALPAASPRTE